MNLKKQVICDIDGQFFSMDSMCVRGIENGKAEMVLGGAPDFVEGIRKFRGEWVPIVRLRTLLGIDRSEETVLSQLIYLRTENGTMAFRVDKVVEIDQLVEGEFQTIPIIVNSGKSVYVQMSSKILHCWGKFILPHTPMFREPADTMDV